MPAPFATIVPHHTNLACTSYSPAGSARQRESDAGALILRTLFVVYSMSLGWHCGSEKNAPSNALKLTLSAPAEMGSEALILLTPGDASVASAAPSPPRESAALACTLFVTSLCDLLEDRLGNLESLFMSFAQDASAPSAVPDSKAGEQLEGGEKDPAPLCHGLLLAMRYCITEAHSGGLLITVNEKVASPGTQPVSNVWRPVVNRVLSLSLDALRVALLVVAEASCDVQFAPAPTAKMRDEYTLPTGSAGDLKTTEASTKVRYHSVDIKIIIIVT